MPLPLQLHILYTGGTLGMQAGDEGLAPASNLAERLRAMLDASDKYTHLPDTVEWSLSEINPLLDSANIIPEDWERIASACVEYQQADAIIIVHGTDTLAYTACALTFLLQNLKIPIIVSGSQKPLEVPESDALENLAGAMLEARHAKPGVWVYFNFRLMPGARVVKKDALHFAGFDTPRLLDAYAGSKAKPLTMQANKRDWASVQIPVVQMVPGFEAKHLEALISTQPDAIILSLYGFGTLADQNSELLDALRHANDQEIIVVAVSQCYIGRIDFSVYATGSRLSRLGVLNGRDITLEAAYTKLMVLFRLGYSNEQLKILFEQNLNNEMSNESI